MSRSFRSKKKTTPAPLILGSPPPPAEEKIELPETVEDAMESWNEGWSFPRMFLLASVAAAILFLVFRSIASSETWPDPEDLEYAVQEEFPESSPANATMITVNHPPNKWELVPVEEWDHSFLVTSALPPKEWTQVSVPGRADLVASDMTCVWGKNAREGLYRGVDFGNTEFAGFAMGSPEGWESSAFAYNILIPKNPSVGAAIKRAERGDQCRIVGTRVQCYAIRNETRVQRLFAHESGELVSPNVIYVSEFLFLSKHNQAWRILSETFKWLALSLFVLAAVAQMFPSSADADA